MTEANINSGSAPQSAAVQITKPANPPPQGAERAIDRTRPQQQNPRAQGYRPAPAWQPPNPRDAAAQSPQRGEQQSGEQQGQPVQQGEQQPGAPAEPQTIKIGDVEYSADQVNDALRFKSEQDIRKSGLPASPDKYEIKLPADFRAPEGVNFQFDPNSAELQNFQRLAHARGLDQQTFSEALGIYAANRVGEQQNLAVARNAEMAKLGAAAGNRIAAIETWLKSQVGAKATLIVNQMKAFPVAGMVEMFEELARNASHQGSAAYSQSGRTQEDSTGRIANYDKLSFSEKRAAQDALNARLGRG